MDKEEDFSRKSKRYRTTYNDNVAALYGTSNCPVLKPPKLRKAARSSGEPIATEWQEQAALVKWSRSRGLLLISIPNHGRRSYWQGQKEVAAGLWRGVSDLFLCMPNGQKFGYWIEMKRKGGKPTGEQLDWLERMRNQGYKAEWWDDWELARDSIIEYLGMHRE